MALKGTLKDFSLADIFQLIGIQRKTGVLTLKNDKEVVTVSFVDGNVVAADSLHRRLEDRLGTVLVKSGRIGEPQLQEALKIQKNTLKRMGNILVESGFIDAQALRDALQIQISQMIYRLFRWRDGEYNFSQEERVDYDADHVVPMSAESILMEGARILDEWPMIEKGIKSFSTVFRQANVEIARSGPGSAAAVDEAARAVTLSEQERQVHALVDGKRSVQEITERCPLSEFDTCRILYELVGRQLIEEVRAGGARSVAPSETAAPVRQLSPALLGIGYLALVLLTGATLAVRARALQRQAPEETLGAALAPLAGTQEVEPIETAIGRSRLQRVDFAIQVYYLLNHGYPLELHYLATSGLLKPDAITDPSGRDYLYEVKDGGYLLSVPTSVDDSGRFEIKYSPPQDSQ
ncbi:MAG TPA: DUF4388 domain-containing protein [Candidatus Polarisedimenticolia bacterium]|nr:DUF4388 domain-containing protein [Candidatus Polarisedimenticolia bacterium]